MHNYSGHPKLDQLIKKLQSIKEENVLDQVHALLDFYQAPQNKNLPAAFPKAVLDSLVDEAEQSIRRR